MEDLFYLSLMAASAPKLIYEGASHFKWEPEGRREKSMIAITKNLKDYMLKLKSTFSK